MVPCTGIETNYIMAGGRHRKESIILKIDAAENK